MANINSVEMGATLSTDTRISIKKSFFSKKVIYNNTESSIKFAKKEYTPEEGMRIQQLFRGETADIVKKAKDTNKFTETGLGNYLLETGISNDHNFAAFRLYHYDQLRYNPIMPILIFEGADAQILAEKF